MAITFRLGKGYSKTDSFAVSVTANGSTVKIDESSNYILTDIKTDVSIKVTGVSDITAPTGKIAVGTSEWKEFLNKITFGLFFKETQAVTITAADDGSGVDKIYYYLSTKSLTKEQIEDLSSDKWKEYTDKFNIDPSNEYIIYAKLTDKAGNVEYISSNGIVLDSVKPVISGIADGETYCEAQTVAVTEKYVDSVTVNGKPPAAVDTKGQLILSPAEGTQTVVVIDKAGNQTEMTVTVNDGHTYEWKSQNGKYWQKCTVCDHETAKKDIPEIKINGANKVHRTQDYTFSFTAPSTVKQVQYAISFEKMGTGGLKPNYENGLYYGTASSMYYSSEESSFTVSVIAETADGYEYSVDKAVTIVDDHTGGTADCTHKAKCEVCDEEYGEINAANHTTLKHTEAKAATVEAEGNIEYWHCEKCGKYFADKDGKSEIKLTDTVIARLTKTDSTGKSPLTEAKSQAALLIAIFFVSGSALIGTAVYGKKKKRSVK